jgi:hypothetical protein
VPMVIYGVVKEVSPLVMSKVNNGPTN